MIAYCGLICTDCPAYRAIKEDNEVKREAVAELWSKEFKQVLGQETSIAMDVICGIRKCGQQKKLDNCGCCADYPCRKVSFVIDFQPRKLWRS